MNTFISSILASFPIMAIIRNSLKPFLDENKSVKTNLENNVSYKLKDLFSKKPEYGLGVAALTQGKYKYLRQSDLNIDVQNIKTFVNDESKFLNKGDVLISRAGTIESYYFNSNEKVCFAGYLIRYNFNQNLLLNKFFYYWTKTKHFLEQAKAESRTGTTMPKLNAPAVSNMSISIPPIEVQKKIIDIIEPLDLTICAIELKENSLKKTIAYYTNFLFKNIDYSLQNKTLGENCKIINGSSNYNQEYCIKNKGIFPVFSAKTTGDVFFAKIDSFDFSKNKTLVTSRGYPGTILFSDENFSITHCCYALIPKENNILDKYLFYYLKKYEKRIKELCFGSTINALYKHKLKNVPINFPALDIQKLIINILDPLNEALKLVQKQKKLYGLKHKHYLNFLIK